MSSFQSVTEEQLAHAKEVCSFAHTTRTNCTEATRTRRRNSVKDGCESWSCAWAPDHSYLAWSAGHSCLDLIPWDVKRQKEQDPKETEGLVGGRKRHQINCGEIVHSVTFGKTSQNCYKQRWRRQESQENSVMVLATGHVSGRIKLWSCDSGRLLLEILDHKEIVHDLHFAQDDSLCLASASRDGTVKLWEFDENGDCNMYLTLRTNTRHAFSCRWSPDRRYVAAVGSNRTALLFRVEGREELVRYRLEDHHHDVVHCDFSPDGALLATASYDTRVVIWDVHKRVKITELGHLFPSPRLIYAGGANDHYVYCVKFSMQGTRLATVAEDGYLRVWEMPSLSDPVYIAEVEGAHCCSFSSDGQLVAVGCLNGSMSVLSVPRDGPEPLLHICRRVIRRYISSEGLKSLPVPHSLQQFLEYQDIVG
ncbi:WD repeat and SOCS box-containing protein 1-like isoform X2 [Babylonia areolata]|uniref:WD repeat and SOCS box-containing protein 1-like isoform X2 n=1 Tax=Babylonia areolata TaxID=304850 RepID=UPI003FD3ED51